MKKVVSLLGVFVMIFGIFSPLQDFFAAENTENVKTYSCNVPGANLKIVEFVPTEYGTYTITVKQTQAASDGSATLFGVAWR